MRPASTPTVLLLSVLLSSAVQAAEWNQFRGPSGQGHATATGLPVRWSPDANVVWRTELPGKGWSSPVVRSGHAYLTTAVPASDADDAPQALRALCVDVESGSLLWNVEVFQQPAGVHIHPKNSHASATAVVDRDRVYVHFGAQGTAALDFDGRILWKNTELKYDPRHGSGGSPVLVDGALVVSCDGYDVQYVAALEQATGKIRWKVPRTVTPAKGFSFCTPLVIEVEGRPQVISTGSDTVSALDPADGKEIWRVTFSGYSVVPRPVYGNGMLYVCTGYDSPSMLAISVAGALGDVSDSHVVWKARKAMPNNPSPVLVADALYTVSDNGVATCLDAKTGAERWQKRVGGEFSASLVYAEGRIYAQSEAGEGVVFAANPRQYEELGRNTIGEKSLASYAVVDQAFLIRSEKRLTRVEAR